MEVVIDVDLENFFGSIDHGALVRLLEMRIKDQTFLRYIVRMLKAGVLAQGELRMTEWGTPQGSICSPVLSNVVAHYAIDEWFEGTVKKHVKGDVAMFRYCDDLVICCRYQTDADRIVRSMAQRLAKYGLKMNLEKTKSAKFSKEKQAKREELAEPFDFLGFTFVLGKARSGRVIPKLKTNSKRLRQKAKITTDWIRNNRCRMKLVPLWLALCKKMAGHIGHYAVSFNDWAVRQFVDIIVASFFKWINRRSQRRSMTWEKFHKFMAAFPPPTVVVKHRLF